MRVDPDELMAYFDGELSPGRSARVERSLERQPAMRSTLTEWESVGDAVRDWSESVSRSHRATADRIMRALEPHETGAIVPFPVLMGPARCARGASGRLARSHSTDSVVDLTGPVRPPARTAWRHAVGAALAFAAAALLLVESADVDWRFGPKMVGPTPVALGLTGRDARAGADDQSGAAIEALDLGERQGAIFFVSAGSEVTPVVWVQDDFASENGVDDDREETL
jgi:anti-sigma factor RsiW